MHPHVLLLPSSDSDAHSSVQTCVPDQTPPRPQLIQCDNDPCRLAPGPSYTDFHSYWWANRPIGTPPENKKAPANAPIECTIRPVTAGPRIHTQLATKWTNPLAPPTFSP